MNSTPGTAAIELINSTIASRFGRNLSLHRYKKMSSLAKIIIRVPFSAFSLTSFMMCSKGNEWRLRIMGEQNLQPRPQPRVISTVPKIEGFTMGRISFGLGGSVSTTLGSSSPLSALRKISMAVFSPSPMTMQSIPYFFCNLAL